jgi:hypothetical protein
MFVKLARSQGHTYAQIVDRYKSLADIERGFSVLKSEIEIAPGFHRLPQRIRAHDSICFMALILYRVMRQRLKAAGHHASPETALSQLHRFQRQSVSINQGVTLTAISNINRDQADLLAAMNVRKPSSDAQLSMLQWKLGSDSEENQPLTAPCVELGRTTSGWAPQSWPPRVFRVSSLPKRDDATRPLTAWTGLTSWPRAPCPRSG